MKPRDKTWREALRRIREETAAFLGYDPGRRAVVVEHHREALAMYRKWLASETASVRWYREQLARAEESAAHNRRCLALAQQSQSAFRKLAAATERLLRLGGTP